MRCWVSFQSHADLEGPRSTQDPISYFHWILLGVGYEGSIPPSTQYVCIPKHSRHLSLSFKRFHKEQEATEGWSLQSLDYAHYKQRLWFYHLFYKVHLEVCSAMRETCIFFSVVCNSSIFVTHGSHGWTIDNCCSCSGTYCTIGSLFLLLVG